MEQQLNLENIEKLAIGTTSEEMRALYFNATALKQTNYSLFQLNTKGKRYYYTYDAEGEPIFFPSVTTILHDVMPENTFLTEWKLSLGKEKSEAYTAEKANYGTFIHGQLAELMIGRKYNLDSVREKLQKYVEKHQLPLGFVDAYEEEAKADIKAFSKWMRDYDVRPYAVEIALYSPSMQIAGMIDCVCNLREYSLEDEKKAIEKAEGDEKKLAKIAEKYGNRIDAIVDFKSGKKGFYDEYKLQLELYRQMWLENFPDTPIEHIFNIAPKDWLKTAGKKPSYSFEEQTNDPILEQIPALLELFRLRDTEERKVVAISGEIDLDSEESEERNVRVYTLSELVKEKATKKEDEEESENENLFE